jgi:hypothetical protein
MRVASLAVGLVVGACSSHHPVAGDAFGTGIDSPPAGCPAPVTQDGSDNSSSTTPQLIPAPSSDSGTTILVLGTPDAGGYASLHGYFKITGLPATKPMQLSLVMGTACVATCSTMVELRSGIHPDIAFLGDNQNGGCAQVGENSSGQPFRPTTNPQGELPLYAPAENNGPNYGYLVEVP